MNRNPAIEQSLKFVKCLSLPSPLIERFFVEDFFLFSSRMQNFRNSSLKGFSLKVLHNFILG